MIINDELKCPRKPKASGFSKTKLSLRNNYAFQAINHRHNHQFLTNKGVGRKRERMSRHKAVSRKPSRRASPCNH
jgi:hypothetical protein